mgnify:CR=1 FL=1
MSRMVLALSILAAVCLISGCGPCETEDPDTVALTLPAGTVEAGKQAFEELRCTACHRVGGVDGLTEPLAQVPVPDLATVLAGQSRGAIASSIVIPPHTAIEETELEPALMTNYADTVTVQQLSDLVIFLQDSAVQEEVP